MISREEALAFTESQFPNGPEALAERLGVKIERSLLEQWCRQNEPQ